MLLATALLPLFCMLMFTVDVSTLPPKTVGSLLVTKQGHSLMAGLRADYLLNRSLFGGQDMCKSDRPSGREK